MKTSAHSDFIFSWRLLIVHIWCYLFIFSQQYGSWLAGNWCSLVGHDLNEPWPHEDTIWVANLPYVNTMRKLQHHQKSCNIQPRMVVLINVKEPSWIAWCLFIHKDIWNSRSITKTINWHCNSSINGRFNGNVVPYMSYIMKSKMRNSTKANINTISTLLPANRHAAL